MPKQLSDWLQVFGLFGVLGGLIFVGMQIRQDRVIAELQVAADFDDTMIAYASVINANRDVWIRGLEGADLSREDQLTFETVAFSVWQKFFGMNRRNRLLDGDIDQLSARQLAAQMFIYPGLKEYVFARCRHRESIGQNLPLCDAIRTQLKSYEDGTLPAPDGSLYVL